MRTTPSNPADTSCAAHPERPAAHRCADCGTALCARCAVEVAQVGTFCWTCAAHRGGLSARRRKLRAPVAEPPTPPTVIDLRAQRTPSPSVRRFEAVVGGREPRQLISGLTERLEAAGVDPTDIVDEEQLQVDIGRMQAKAAEQPPRHSRRRH